MSEGRSSSGDDRLARAIGLTPSSPPWTGGGLVHGFGSSGPISDFEQARQALQDEVIPQVTSAPGFVSGYWLAPIDGKGLSVFVFEDEDAARGMLAMVQPGSIRHRS